jgi:hypothetical protein
MVIVFDVNGLSMSLPWNTARTWSFFALKKRFGTPWSRPSGA